MTENVVGAVHLTKSVFDVVKGVLLVEALLYHLSASLDFNPVNQAGYFRAEPTTRGAGLVCVCAKVKSERSHIEKSGRREGEANLASCESVSCVCGLNAKSLD
jgi:hypothetical protein